MAKEKSKFMQWYESYNGKKVVNMVYCLGAAVVIVGALFKIMHFPGAGPLLMCGMCTEAILFAIGCFDKPHAEFKWSNVFPQLIGEGADPEELAALADKPRPTLLGMGSDNNVAATDTPEAKKANVPALTDKEFEALKGSISDLANTASQLSEIGKIADKTNKLGEKIDAAGAAADKFIGSQEGISNASAAFAKNLESTGANFIKNIETSATTLNTNVNTAAATLNEKVATAAATLVKGVDDSAVTLNKSMAAVADAIGKNNADLNNAYASVVSQMQNVANGSKTFEQQVNTVNQKLTALNSVYELQINAMQAQVNAFNTQTSQINALSQSVQKVQTATTQAAKNSEEYQAATEQLSKQVADLNKIYGNMLTALK